MKIQYASDLHLEFPLNSSYLEKVPLNVEGDILVLAGDIAYLGHRIVNNHPFFEWRSKNYRQALIVPGNHEFYYQYPLENTLDGWQKDLKENVCYANNKSFRIGDTELFLTTLWSKIDQIYEKRIWNAMSDFSCIRLDGKRLVPTDYARLCERSLQWLNEALAASNAKHKIVASHHCPTCRAEFNKYPGSLLTSAFQVDLNSFIEQHPDIDYWIYGHTHFNGGPETPAARIGNTQLLCNQLGYLEMKEGEGFRHNAVISFEE